MSVSRFKFKNLRLIVFLKNYFENFKKSVYLKCILFLYNIQTEKFAGNVINIFRKNNE